MSGRSAYVRKKITEPKGKAQHGPDANLDELPTLALGPSRQDSARLGTAHGRGPRPQDLTVDGDVLSIGDSQSSGSIDGRRLDSAQPKHPLDDFAYARARKPTIKAEDISGVGISKSGMRSVMDQNSEKVRKGIAKAFTFGGKKTRRDEVIRPQEIRPESSATVRPGHLPRGGESEPSPLEDREQPPYPQANYTYDPQWDASLGPASPPPVTKLPALPPPASTPQIKRWTGTGRPVQRWNKLRKDPELWDPNGDVLVYLGHRGQNPRPNPSFRLSSHVIEATESRPLITMLREGSTEDEMTLLPSPRGAPPMLLPRQSSVSAAARDQMAAGQRPQASSRSGSQATPPLSEDTILTNTDGQISYEIFFSPPSNASKTEQIRYSVSVRNLFGILHHASLVGLSLCQALSDLHSRMEQFMPQADTDNLSTILAYLGARGIDDVRNDAESAISLLAWCEDPKVRWEEGWRESFLHVAGMYGSLRERSLMESSPDFKRISPITRALLERASLEMHLRVQAAEEPLSTFSFEDMWPASLSFISPASGPVVASPAKASADRLQRFLLSYYRSTWGRWPPPPPPDTVTSDESDEPLWLTRTVVQALQKDFGTLYDYLVNRDIVWDGSETRSSRKWLMVSESGNKAFEADTDELPMTDVLIEYDNKQRFPHIPHPYPLVPESIPPAANTAASAANSKGRKRSKTGGEAVPAATPGGPQRPGAVERRIQLAYTEATNVYVLGSDFAQTDLIDAFVKFEKTDRIGEIDPSLARRGRWILIYGILQSLASVSADAPIVRYSDGVDYHLGPRLKGARLPPWAKKGKQPASIQPQEASHELSYCWLAPRAWNNSNTSASEEGGLDSQEVSDDNNSPIDTRQGYSFPQPPHPSLSATLSGVGGGGGGGGRGYTSAQSSRAPSASGQSRGYHAGTSYAGSTTSYDALSDAGTTTSSWLHMSTTSSVTTAPLQGGRTSKASSRTGVRGVARSTEALGSRRGGGAPQLASPGSSTRLDEAEEAADGGEWPMQIGGRDRDRDRDRERGKLHISTEMTSSSGGRTRRREGSRQRKESFGVVREGGEDSDDQQWVVRRMHSRPLLSPSETSSVAQAIKDFDELDVDDIIPR
ncbi:hypothetical protein KVR01_006789 [Diaporthe batatas]|uniref:uncharacterized protein n=1 Tax=Diaporthe batatas TaxID=748121 RepID=UPI001D04AA0E|nr:uncharacterized protein KVR01_006789 [Diaporthe batatas]KAG8163492.1 hypothetical protein KVR01_006789 [Diaporthe batatas]